MPNKKLLIAMGIAILILFISIIYRVNQDKKELKNIPEDQITVVDNSSLDKEEIDEIMTVFTDVERSFYNITEQIFLMEDDVIEMLSDNILEIEKSLSNVKIEIEEGVQNRDIIYENITNIQKKIQDLTEKLIELHS
jgi:hypothetical protein